MAPRFFLLVALFATSTLATETTIPNRLIDYDAFADNVSSVGSVRESRRITEKEFIRMAADPATIVLDARSSEKFALLHVKGARNLSLPDITEEELARIIPAKTTRILIYCNNNFQNEQRAFPSKLPAASLNVHTMNVLYAYGYRNVYELGPLIDIRKTRIAFAGTTSR